MPKLNESVPCHNDKTIIPTNSIKIEIQPSNLIFSLYKKVETTDVIIGVVAIIMLEVAEVRDCSPMLKKTRYRKKPNNPEIKNLGISCFLGIVIF